MAKYHNNSLQIAIEAHFIRGLVQLQHTENSQGDTSEADTSHGSASVRINDMDNLVVLRWLWIMCVCLLCDPQQISHVLLRSQKWDGLSLFCLAFNVSDLGLPASYAQLTVVL